MFFQRFPNLHMYRDEIIRDLSNQKGNIVITKIRKCMMYNTVHMYIQYIVIRIVTYILQYSLIDIYITTYIYFLTNIIFCSLISIITMIPLSIFPLILIGPRGGGFFSFSYFFLFLKKRFLIVYAP